MFQHDKQGKQNKDSTLKEPSKKRIFDYAVGNWVLVTYRNRFIEDGAAKVLHFLPCKQEFLQTK